MFLLQTNNMVEQFAKQLQGIAVTDNGWVQSCRSRYVKPPVIYGDVSHLEAMTARPVKGMLIGPITILNGCFARSDQAR